MPNATGAIAYALAQIGKPYIWGAQGPNAYDCSGLMYAAYRSIGIDIPRTTYEQLGSGLQQVSRPELAPGDLVFPESGHVQMYLGNGKIVEAPRPGLPVRVSTVGTVWQARRVTTPGTVSDGRLGTVQTAVASGTAQPVNWLTDWLSGLSPSQLESSIVEGLAKGMISAFEAVFTPFLTLIFWIGFTVIGAGLIIGGAWIIYGSKATQLAGKLMNGQN